MRFTRAEFDTMVEELLLSTPVSFNMLCVIAEKTLRPYVISLCANDEWLRGRCCEDDIMQEISVKLIKSTVSDFLKHAGAAEPFNDDPEGFGRWMFTVAKRKVIDFSRNVRSKSCNMVDIEAVPPEKLAVDEFSDAEETETHRERLRQALSIVLEADVGVYKVLTWLAQFLFVLGDNKTKIESNKQIIKDFENKTLYEMYAMLLNASQKLPWIVVTPEQRDRLMRALRKKRDGDISYGDTTYRSFFMRYNGEISGRKSISDWVNRMNGTIKQKNKNTDPAGIRVNSSDTTERKKG